MCKLSGMKKYLQLLNCLYTICMLLFAFTAGGNIFVNQENIFCSNLPANPQQGVQTVNLTWSDFNCSIQDHFPGI